MSEDVPETAELIARLELAKRSLPNIEGGTGEAQAEVIGEAQVALAQAQEIGRLTERKAGLEGMVAAADKRAEAAEARVRELQKAPPSRIIYGR